MEETWRLEKVILKEQNKFPEFSDYLDKNYHLVGMSTFVNENGGKLT